MYEAMVALVKECDNISETKKRALMKYYTGLGSFLLMFPYLLIIPERFNDSLARAVAGATEALRRATIRPFLQEGAV